MRREFLVTWYNVLRMMFVGLCVVQSGFNSGRPRDTLHTVSCSLPPQRSSSGSRGASTVTTAFVKLRKGDAVWEEQCCTVSCRSCSFYSFTCCAKTKQNTHLETLSTCCSVDTDSNPFVSPSQFDWLCCRSLPCGHFNFHHSLKHWWRLLYFSACLTQITADFPFIAILVACASDDTLSLSESL